MPLTQKLSAAAATIQVNALATEFDGGFMDVMSGTQPATGDTAITTQVRLATFTFGVPAFAAGVAGVAAANAMGPEADAPATGEATWFRCYKADHTTPLEDGSVGLSGCNVNLNNVNIQQHAVVSLDAYSLTAKRS